jgi:hypothetical protein
MKASSLVSGIVAVALGAGLVEAQQPGGMMGRDSLTMMRMDSLDRRLDSLVGVMNKAKGDKKVTAIAAVINELVEQRRAVHRRMGQMLGPHPGTGRPR